MKAIKWEYKEVPIGSRYLIEKLNELGEDGWELASTVSEGYDFERNTVYHFIFKRPIES